ncbi:MAG: D-alanyl-D-alanine carboxypeptidase, partial [Planctomycetota bacterium]
VLTCYFSAPKSGSRIGLRTEPEIKPEADWVQIDDRTRVAERGRHTAWIARPRPANVLTAYGEVVRGGTAKVEVAVHQPQLVFGNLLAERIARFSGEERGDAARIGVRLASEGESLEGGVTVARVQSLLRDALRRANTNSQNLYTEAMIKRVGHEVTGTPGSWTNGAAVIRLLLAEKLGADHAAAVSIGDGSGLSRENLIPPETMTAWLAMVFREDEETRDAFIDSMPVPGTGTLRDRFAGSRVENDIRAKSGTINGVRCLSGYVVSRADPSRAVAFSVLINDITGGRQVRAAKRLHEQVALAVDGWVTETDRERGVVPAGNSEPSQPAALGG